MCEIKAKQLEMKVKANKTELHKNFWTVLPWIWLALMFVIYIVYLNAHATQHLDADMSSEMVLSHLLSEEGGILSENWYYSTELRVVNTQLVLSFFFRIFNSWHLVRIFSSAALMLILLASFYYLCVQMGCRKYFPLAGSILLIPFCSDYYDFVMLGLYYYPHISFTFISLGLVFHYGNAKRKWEQTAVLGAAFLVSMLAALGGPRQILVTYLPMLLTSCGCIFLQMSRNGFRKVTNQFWSEKTVSYAACSLFFMAGCFVGHRINTTILSVKYPFQHYFGLAWTEFSWDGLVTVFRGFLAMLGYSEGYVMSGTTIRNGVALLFAVLLVWYIGQVIGKTQIDEVLFVALTLFFGIGCYVILYAFTDMMYSQRYILPIMILIIPLFACAMKYGLFSEGQDSSLTEKTSKLQMYLPMGILCCTFVSGLLFYQEKGRIDMTADLRSAVEAVKEDYSTGYATFWNANIVTELSDGKIDMYDWLDSKSPENLANVDTLYEWLQVKRHHEHPDGKVFLLFTSEEFGRYTLCQRISKDDALFDSGGYLVFGYDNYETMAEDLAK